MTTFNRFLKELDANIATSKAGGHADLPYRLKYLRDVSENTLAGVEIALSPSIDEEGRLLYISTSMKVWFGEIDTISNPEQCEAWGIPVEHPESASAGSYCGYRVVGRAGLVRLLSLASDDCMLRAANHNRMGNGLEPLGTRASSQLHCEYKQTSPDPSRPIA